MDLFAGQDLVLLTRYSGDGPTRLAFDGRSAAGPVHWETNVDFPEHDRDNPFVPRLWATRRIGWLSAERRQHGAITGARRRAAYARRALWHSDGADVISGAGAADGWRTEWSRRDVPMAAPAATFEAARSATMQRDAKSVDASDG